MEYAKPIIHENKNPERSVASFHRYIKNQISASETKLSMHGISDPPRIFDIDEQIIHPSATTAEQSVVAPLSVDDFITPDHNHSTTSQNASELNVAEENTILSTDDPSTSPTETTVERSNVDKESDSLYTFTLTSEQNLFDTLHTYYQNTVQNIRHRIAQKNVRAENAEEIIEKLVTQMTQKTLSLFHETQIYSLMQAGLTLDDAEGYYNWRLTTHVSENPFSLKKNGSHDQVLCADHFFDQDLIDLFIQKNTPSSPYSPKMFTSQHIEEMQEELQNL